MSPPPLVGITGFARSGKDTCAEALAPFGHTRMGFADKLKELALQINPEVAPSFRLRRAVELWGWEMAKDTLPGVRYCLKHLANSCRVVFGADFWISHLPIKGGYEVVSDVRFLDEAAYLRSRGAVMLRVTRPGYGMESEFERQVPMIPVDLTIINDGTVEQLQERVRSLISAYVWS